MTPSLARKIQAQLSPMQCFSLVLDKVDLIQALEFGDDLKNL